MEKIWIITDTDSSFSASSFHIPGRELGFDDTGYCRKVTLSAGRQAGVEIIGICNGVLTLRVCPSRGMGIIDGRFGAHALGWRSPTTWAGGAGSSFPCTARSVGPRPVVSPSLFATILWSSRATFPSRWSLASTTCCARD